MRFSRSLPLVLALAAVAPAGLRAQARHDGRQPAAICRDGTRSAVSGRGACAGHGGIGTRVGEKAAKKQSKPATVGVVQQGRNHDDNGATAHAKKAKAVEAKARAVKHVSAAKAVKPAKHAKPAREKKGPKEAKAAKHGKPAVGPKPSKASKASKSAKASKPARKTKDAKSVRPEHHAGLRRVEKSERSEIRIATMGAHPVAPADTARR